MSAFTIPIIPSQMRINGQTSIPPPSAEDFDSYFGGFLPERRILNSALGQTAYYLYSNTANEDSYDSNTASSKPPRYKILMHGGSTPSINLIHLVKRILALTPASQPTHLLLYDIWGHGLSSTPLQPATSSLFHTQLLQLLQHLNWPAVHLLGYSVSASLAVSFAQYYPSALASLTLVGPTGLLHSSDIAPWTRLLRTGGPSGLWHRTAVHSILNFVDGGAPPSPPLGWREKLPIYDMDAVQVWQRENHRGHVAILVAMYHDVGVFDMHVSYKAVAKGRLGREKKTLVLLGELDETFGGEMMRKELEGCGWDGEVVDVPDVGHLIIRMKPEEVADLLMGFWERCEQQRVAQ